MTYDSQILFTLDTICPWTYLAKKRLDEALANFRESDEAEHITFTVKYMPYQLYPKFSEEGEDKYEWYMREKYNSSKEKMLYYATTMKAHGAQVGIKFKFSGTIANTFNAHRTIQYFQEEKGPEVADKIVNSLYSLYFENEQHPSAPATLIKAITDAGVPEAEAKAFVEDKNEYKFDTEAAIREQAGNQVDAVPYIVIEGKRRDITLEGAKEVEEYEKALAQIIKESM